MTKIFVLLVGSLWLVLSVAFAVRGAVLRLTRAVRGEREPGQTGGH